MRYSVILPATMSGYGVPYKLCNFKLGKENWMEITLRFYGELNDFLPPRLRQIEFTLMVHSRTSVKDAVESVKVPHTEVALIQINGRMIDWNQRLSPNDRIAVYPSPYIIEWVNCSPVYLRPVEPLRFVLDVHLGRLAAYLRLLGFDCLYSSRDVKDQMLIELALEENRILLTMDRKMLMNKQLKWGRIIRSRDPIKQVEEVIERYRLRDKADPFSRCMVCNERLSMADENHFRRTAPECVKQTYTVDQLRQCDNCGRLYWQGSHWKRMTDMVRMWGVE